MRRMRKKVNRRATSNNPMQSDLYIHISICGKLINSMFSFVAGILSSNSSTLELWSHGTYAGYNGGNGQDFWNLNRNIQQEQQPVTLACIKQKKKRKKPVVGEGKEGVWQKANKKQEQNRWKYLMMSCNTAEVLPLTARTWEDSKPK